MSGDLEEEGQDVTPCCSVHSSDSVLGVLANVGYGPPRGRAGQALLCSLSSTGLRLATQRQRRERPHTRCARPAPTQPTETATPLKVSLTADVICENLVESITK